MSLEPQILAVLLILFLLAISISGRLPRWTGGGRSSLINSSSRICLPSFQRSVRSCAWIIFQPRYALHPRHTISWIVYAPDVISWIEGRSYRTFVLEISRQLERVHVASAQNKGVCTHASVVNAAFPTMTKQPKNKARILVRYHPLWGNGLATAKENPCLPANPL